MFAINLLTLITSGALTSFIAVEMHHYSIRPELLTGLLALSYLNIHCRMSLLAANDLVSIPYLSS
jgi:hypothetical protein